MAIYQTTRCVKHVGLEPRKLIPGIEMADEEGEGTTCTRHLLLTMTTSSTFYMAEEFQAIPETELKLEYFTYSTPI